MVNSYANDVGVCDTEHPKGGGATIKSMSAAFMADVERAWRKHGAKVLDVLAEKYPQAFFGGMVAITKVIRWETATDAGGFDPLLVAFAQGESHRRGL